MTMSLMGEYRRSEQKQDGGIILNEVIELFVEERWGSFFSWDILWNEVGTNKVRKTW